MCPWSGRHEGSDEEGALGTQAPVYLSQAGKCGYGTDAVGLQPPVPAPSLQLWADLTHLLGC